MISLGHRIKDYREARGLSQQDIADVLKMSRPTYNAIESGKREPTLSELRVIAGSLGMALEELLFNSQQAAQNRDMIAKFKEVILNCLQYGSDEHDRKLTKTKLAKLVYLSDFAYYSKTGRPMTGLSYRHIPQGPVSDTYFRIIDELFENGAITIEQRGTAMMIHANEVAPQSLLSEEERDLIISICEKWQQRPTQEIVEFTHRQIPWKTSRQEDIIPYELIKQEAPGYVY